MKKLLSTICAITLFAMPIGVVITSTGCTTSQKVTAYQTLASVGIAVDNAMKAYAQGVQKGLVTPDERAKVSILKMQYNAAYIVACDAASFNYQTFAPDDLIKVKNSLLALLVEVTQ